MDVSEDHAEQLLRAEHHVLVWDKGPAHGHGDPQECDGSEDVFHSQHVFIVDGEGNKHGQDGASEEGAVLGQQCQQR